MRYLFILLFLPLFGKSQQIPTYDSLGNVTYYTEDTIKLPYSVAKQVAKDLVSGDSAKAVLELTKEQLTLTEDKVVLKDSIISNHVQKGIMYEERIKNEQLKFETQGKWVDELRKQNKTLKVKLIFTKITLSAIIGGITYLYFTK
jgi:CRISPR/Cas system CMR subunit Cmr4 (Cas7 group RAMP superfamily)